MATITRYQAEQYITQVFNEYLEALKKAKKNKKKILPEAYELFEGMEEFNQFVKSVDLQQKVYNRLNIQGIEELLTGCVNLSKLYDLQVYDSIKDIRISEDDHYYKITNAVTSYSVGGTYTFNIEPINEIEKQWYEFYTKAWNCYKFNESTKKYEEYVVGLNEQRMVLDTNTNDRTFLFTEPGKYKITTAIFKQSWNPFAQKIPELNEVDEIEINVYGNTEILESEENYDDCWKVYLDKDNKPKELELGKGNSVLVVYVDNRIQRYEYPGVGSRAGFLAKYIDFPILANGTSPETEKFLESNGITYDEKSKLWRCQDNSIKHLDIVYTQKDIKSDYSQKDIGNTLGLNPNKTCLLTCWIKIYELEGIPLDSLSTISKQYIGDCISTPDANLNDQLKLSDAYAEGLNRNDTKYLQYPWIDGKQVLYKTEIEFFNNKRKYPYAIVEWNSPEKSNDDHHYTLLILSTKEHFDPWPNGIKSCDKWEKAYIGLIRPLMWSSWRNI